MKADERRCICIADHDLNGTRVQCRNYVSGPARKCADCKGIVKRAKAAR